MFEDTLSSKKNRKRSKLPQQNSNKRLSSSSNNTESDGETNSMKDEQMVPNSTQSKTQQNKPLSGRNLPLVIS